MKNHYHRQNFAKNAVIYIKKIIYGYFKDSFNFWHKLTIYSAFLFLGFFLKNKNLKAQNLKKEE